MPLRDDILNPISGDNPSGASLRYAPVYDKIKEARREDDDTPQGEWARERKLADWPLTIKLCTETIATKSKDLQLAAWLTEALLRKEGITGLCDGLELMRGLVENFWDTLYPELEDGDAEFRATPLQWVGDRLDKSVKLAPLTRSGLNWFQYKESRAVPTEEQAAESSEKGQARADAIAEGKIAPEVFNGAFDSTPKSYFVKLTETYDATLEALTALGELCDEKFGDVAPTFGNLQRVLEEVRQTAVILLNKKRETEPDADQPPAAEPEPEPDTYQQAYQSAVAYAPAAVAAAPARAPARAMGPEPADLEDAAGRVVVVARYLRQQDAYSPAPYLLLRGLRWGELRAAGIRSIDANLLAAPSTEIRQNIKRLAMDGNWTEALEASETAMGMDCGRGWLDLQRYVCRACENLGYQAILDAVKSGVRALLADYPDLSRMTLLDDTPTANAETLAWIEEQVAPAPAAAQHASEYDAPPAVAREESVATDQTPDVYDMAMDAVRQRRPQDALEMLIHEIAAEPSGRGKFQRKIQLAQVCLAMGHDGIALPILAEIAAEIDRRKLEEWETADTLAHPLALLYRCSKDATPEDKKQLYARICRLDALKALSVSK